MLGRTNIAVLLSVLAGGLFGCSSLFDAAGMLALQAMIDVPALCPPPVIEREEVDLPGFGTLVRFKSRPYVGFSSLNNRNHVALNTIGDPMLATCGTAVVVGDSVAILARPNVDTFVVDLNDRGLAVGFYRPAGGDWPAPTVVWRDGAFIPLSDPDGPHGVASALNNNNVIVGTMSDDEGFELVRWQPEGDAWTMTRLGVRGARPSDVNDRGEIVGVVWEPLPSERDVTRSLPFIWQDGSLTMLPTLGGAGTGYSVDVTSINNAGWIVGRLDLPVEGELGEDERPVERAVVWRDGQVIELASLGGSTSIAHDVNESGQIVGSSQTAEGDAHACIWEGGVLRDLNDLLPDELGITLRIGLAINDHGVIFAETTEPAIEGPPVVMLIPSSVE